MRLFCVVAAAVAAAWAIFVYFLAPFAIEEAYQGAPILSHLMRGRATTSLASYLTTWHQVAGKLSFVLVIGGIYAGLAAFGSSRDAAAGPGEGADRVAISPGRRLVVYGLATLILGGNLLQLAGDTQHWPFSPYPMFSVLNGRKTVTIYRLYGVVQWSPLVEIQLDNNLYLRPFDTSRMSHALEHAYRNNTLNKALTNCLTRYEALRRAKRHNGPPLVAMRAYKVTWAAEPSAGNIDRPERRQLLGQVVARNARGNR